MKKNANNSFTKKLIFQIKDDALLKNIIKYTNKINIKCKINYNLIIFFNFIILFLCISLSQEISHLRKLNVMQEIVLTVNSGEIQILNNEFTSYPDKIYINDVEFNNTEGEQTKKFTLGEGSNTIKLCYSTAPQCLKNMFKDLKGITKIDLSNFDTSNAYDMSHMFDNCEDLKEINFTNFKTSSVTTMEFMFNNCKKIISLDLSSFITMSVNNMKYMFTACEGLQYIDVSNFQTTSVTQMALMFCDCRSLESIDISNFQTISPDMGGMFQYCLKLKSIKFSDTNKIGTSNIASMFQDCWSLTSIDLSNFNLSASSSLEYLFDKCYNLISVNLSKLDTSSINKFNNMFSDCQKLEFLDLTNFKTTSANNFKNMFNGCSSLIYLNINNFDFRNNSEIDGIFNNVPNTTKYCYDIDKAPSLSFQNSSCSDICFSKNIKLISELAKCVNNCSEDENYKYEYENKCYKECPNETISSTENEFICKQILTCQNYSDINRTRCFDEIPIGYFLSDIDEKLIDKCHEYCKTCEKKETENNTNCLTCKDNYFFFNGNCSENCSNGYYYDNSNNKICKCPYDSKCKNCSIESISQNSCISCNDGFYRKNTDIHALFPKCYKEIEGYYLFDDLFYPCYETCKNCSQRGDSNSHNCDLCKDDFIIINELNKEKNCYKKCDYYYYIASNNEYSCTITNECPYEYSKLISEKKKCIDICSKDDTYKYEFNNFCYIKCPNGTINENYICKEEETDIITEEITDKITDKETDIITEKVTDKITDKETDITTEKVTDKFTDKETDIITEKVTDKLTYQEITVDTDKITNNEITQNINSELTTSQNNEKIQNWSSKNFFSGLCFASGENQLNKDDIIKNIRTDIITNNLDTLIKEVINEKQDKYVEEDNVIYQITTSDNQNNNNYTNISSIHLGECEKILKKKYGLKDNETLIILKIDYKIPGLLIPIIGYEVFDSVNKSKLNLSYCEQSSINYNIPVSIDEDSLFKYDTNSDYYNDECNTYTTENGTDILLNDRKEEFSKNNMSLCENICEYNGYDLETKKALCECGIRYKEFLLSELDNDTNLLQNNLTLDNTTSNMGSMKCYQTLFTKEGLLTNIGSYILLIIIVLHLVSIIVFYKCGYAILDANIQDIIDEKKRLKKMETKENNKNSKRFTIFNISHKAKTSCKNSIYSNGKKPNNKKNSIYSISKVQGKKKNEKDLIDKKKNNLRNSNLLNSKKQEKIKRRKNQSISNPSKKVKRKKDKIVCQENTNISSNAKSFTKLKIRENKYISMVDKEKRRSSRSSNIFKKNNSKISSKEIPFKPKFYNMSYYNDFELNTMNYKEALEIDKRTYIQYYKSLLVTKHPIIFTFFSPKDYNVLIIKICLLFLSFAIYYAFNTLFFDFSIIHKVYKDQGDYNISYLFPLIFYSFIISYYINIVIKYIVLSERNILEIKNQNSIKKANDKVPNVERCLIIKNICYFIISVAFLIFFWYYLASFCAVYQNSQIHVIKNTFISFSLSLLFPFIINLLPGIFRIISLKNKKQNCLYITSKIIQLL